MSENNNASAFISFISGYTFTPEESEEIKEQIDRCTHPRSKKSTEEIGDLLHGPINVEEMRPMTPEEIAVEAYRRGKASK
jgi:hypothetical protein